jgi:hypothetical protein
VGHDFYKHAVENMTDGNHREDVRNQKIDDGAFDRELDSALAKYAAVEPRAGLGDRILANLRIEQKHAAKRSRWRWPAVASPAALIVVAVLVAWRSWRPAQNIAKQHPRATTQANGNDATQLAHNGGILSIGSREGGPRRRLKTRAFSNPATIVLPAPKLEQFPSLQPLSEQETILTRYVANYPEHAALIAQARSDELRRDSAEEMNEAVSTSNENSQQRNNNK